MKALLFNVNKDEIDYINECNGKFRFDLDFADFDFNAADSGKFLGFDAVWITTNCKVTEEKSRQLKAAGIQYIVSRAAGTDHINLDAIKAAGIRGANVPRYSPNAIAEHTLCLVLMSLRKMKRELAMINGCDFTLTGLKGRELRNMTVGVIGTGRIGAETIKLLRGFGCKILAYDIFANKEIMEFVTYADLQDVMKESEVLILHCPLTKDNERFINADTLAVMKEGAVIINTARGGLMDYDALLTALEKGKISAAAFDVYDDETPYIRKKVAPGELKSETLKKLLQKENVIYTAHMSFYTDTAIENMILTTFENLNEYEKTSRCSNDIY